MRHFHVLVIGIILIAVAFVIIATINPYKIIYRFNEEAAISSIKDIRSAQASYKSIHGRYGTLTDLYATNLVGRSLKDGVRSGFIFNIESNGSSYIATAFPKTFAPDSNDYSQNSGGISLFVNESGIIRIAYLHLNGGKAANIDDPPLK